MNQYQPNQFLRLSQIVKSKSNPHAILPIGKTAFLDGVARGDYPQPIKLPGARTIAWRYSELMDFLNNCPRATYPSKL